MKPSRQLNRWAIEVRNALSFPPSHGQDHTKVLNSGLRSMQTASMSTRTVKVERRNWNIGQQVYEGNLIEFGIDPEVAAKAACYVKYADNVLSLKGKNMLFAAFSWSDTEEGEDYWLTEYNKAQAIEEMWSIVSKEEKDV